MMRASRVGLISALALAGVWGSGCSKGLRLAIRDGAGVQDGGVDSPRDGSDAGTDGRTQDVENRDATLGDGVDMGSGNRDASDAVDARDGASLDGPSNPGPDLGSPDLGAGDVKDAPNGNDAFTPDTPIRAADLGGSDRASAVSDAREASSADSPGTIIGGPDLGSDRGHDGPGGTVVDAAADRIPEAGAIDAPAVEAARLDSAADATRDTVPDGGAPDMVILHDSGAPDSVPDTSPDTSPSLVGPAICDGTPGTQATVLFRIPRVTDPVNNDFYRLPFPNDIRKRNGRINMQGHPRPGSSLVLSFDIVDRYITAIEADSTGFGTNQAVYLRFSRDPQLATLSLSGAVALVDITPGSPDYGHTKSITWAESNPPTEYLCNRHMMIRPAFGQPLRPGTTYAAIVRQTATDTDGHAFGQDADFAAMLTASAPVDPDLAAAWAAYAPLRLYFGDTSVSVRLTAADLAVAAVFTTEQVEQPLAAIHTAIKAAAAPTLSTIVHCGDTGVVSPCDDGKTGAAHLRGCSAITSASFDEYQGTVSLPVFQQGTPPYAQPADGGGIFLDASGNASIVRNEPVCFSLTVPKGTAPTAGWPLVIYSHGTGGSYRSAIELLLAADYAGGVATGGAAVPMATLGYDGVLHGTRNGGSTASPDSLVYNFYNPRAARDNNLQAAADLLALPRAFSGQVTTAIKIDGSHVALYGHSQGGNATALAAARDAGYGAAVMSGTGGTIMLSLLLKTQPINLPVLLPIMLHDSPVDQNHPVLNLLQMYFERSDPVNFARRLFFEPLAGAQRRHVLHIYGTSDTYAPNETQRRYAQAAAFQVALPLLDSYPTLAEYSMTTVASPIVANQSFGALSPITAAQAQYAPSGYDGHFVSTLNAAARTAIQKMLVTLTRETNPIVEP